MFLICGWTNVWEKKQDAGDLRRHRAHYDVSVMIYTHKINQQDLINKTEQNKTICDVLYWKSINIVQLYSIVFSSLWWRHMSVQALHLALSHLFKSILCKLKYDIKALHYWSFVRGIHLWLDSSHKGPVMQKAFPNNVIIYYIILDNTLHLHCMIYRHMFISTVISLPVKSQADYIYGEMSIKPSLYS